LKENFVHQIILQNIKRNTWEITLATEDLIFLSRSDSFT
jgi:hypothetical protein